MAIPISDGYCPSRRTDMEELIYTLIFLINKSMFNSILNPFGILGEEIQKNL